MRTIDKHNHQIGDLIVVLGSDWKSKFTAAATYDGSSWSHVGGIVDVNGHLMILEAVSPRVKLTEIDDFLSKTVKWSVQRCNLPFDRNLMNNYAKTFIGLPYGWSLLFRDLYYCLVRKVSGKAAIQNVRQPMSGITCSKLWAMCYLDQGIRIKDVRDGQLLTHDETGPYDFIDSLEFHEEQYS